MVVEQMTLIDNMEGGLQIWHMESIQQFLIHLENVSTQQLAELMNNSVHFFINKKCNFISYKYHDMCRILTQVSWYGSYRGKVAYTKQTDMKLKIIEWFVEMSTEEGKGYGV